MKNDVSNFVEIAVKAHQILDGCAIHQGLAGWTRAGESQIYFLVGLMSISLFPGHPRLLGADA